MCIRDSFWCMAAQPSLRPHVELRSFLRDPRVLQRVETARLRQYSPPAADTGDVGARQPQHAGPTRPLRASGRRSQLVAVRELAGLAGRSAREVVDDADLFD